MNRNSRRRLRSRIKPGAVEPEIVTRRLVLADRDGRCRATLSCDGSTGRPEFSIYGEAGRRRVSIRLRSGDRPEVTLFAENGLKAMASLALDDQGLPRLKMQDSESETQVIVSARSVRLVGAQASHITMRPLWEGGGAAGIFINGPGGSDGRYASASLEVPEDGSSTMRVHGRDNRAGVSIKAEEDGTSTVGLGIGYWLQLRAGSDGCCELSIPGPNGSSVSVATRARQNGSVAEIRLEASNGLGFGSDHVTAELDAGCDAKAGRKAVLRFMDGNGQVLLNTTDGTPGLKFWSEKTGTIKIP